MTGRSYAGISGQVLPDVVVERQGPVLGEQQDGRGGELLGDRPDVEHRARRDGHSGARRWPARSRGRTQATRHAPRRRHSLANADDRTRQTPCRLLGPRRPSRRHRARGRPERTSGTAGPSTSTQQRRQVMRIRRGGTRPMSKSSARSSFQPAIAGSNDLCSCLLVVIVLWQAGRNVVDEHQRVLRRDFELPLARLADKHVVDANEVVAELGVERLVFGDWRSRAATSSSGVSSAPGTRCGVHTAGTRTARTASRVFP